MTWQEELRKLDEDLAAGKLAADEYRTRRDQVLSSAVTPEDPSQQGQSQGSTAEATQTMRPAGTNAERTQAVPSWNTPQQQRSSPSSGYSQQPSGSSSAGAQQPAQQQPGASWSSGSGQQHPWNAPQDDVSPPWGGSDLPPVAQEKSPSWTTQGPESFDNTPKKGNGRKVALSVILVVVLVGIGVGVWALFIRSSNTGGTAPTAAPPAPTSSQTVPTKEPLPEPPPAKEKPADNAAALIDPPGDERAGGGEFDLAALHENGLLPKSVVSALEEAGFTKGLLKTTTSGDVTIGLYALAVANEDAAATVAHEYALAQQEGGLPASRKHSLQGVPVFGTSKGGDAVFRAVYVLYDRVIIVDVYGPSDSSVEETFENILQQQVKHAPPTKRQDR